MIGVNPLHTRVLATVDEVIFHAPTENDIDARSILQNIIIAERSFILPMIGFSMYDALTIAKNKVVTDANKADLQTELNQGRQGRPPIALVAGDMVNSDSYLSQKDQDLWRDHLHKIVAECVYFSALPVNRSRFGAQGVNVNNPASIASTSNVASIELKDLKHLIDNALLRRINPLMEAMHEYICRNGYSSYAKDCNCNTDGTPYQKRSSISFGMYDTDDDCGCNKKTYY